MTIIIFTSHLYLLPVCLLAPPLILLLFPSTYIPPLHSCPSLPPFTLLLFPYTHHPPLILLVLLFPSTRISHPPTLLSFSSLPCPPPLLTLLQRHLPYLLTVVTKQNAGKLVSSLTAGSHRSTLECLSLVSRGAHCSPPTPRGPSMLGSGNIMLTNGFITQYRLIVI